MYPPSEYRKAGKIPLTYVAIVALCTFLAGCNVNITSGGSNLSGISSSNSSTGTCSGDCTIGSGVQGIQLYVEPDAGDSVITNAINSAQKSVWVEMYLLTDRKIISALEEAAHRGIDT